MLGTEIFRGTTQIACQKATPLEPFNAGIRRRLRRNSEVAPVPQQVNLTARLHGVDLSDMLQPNGSPHHS